MALGAWLAYRVSYGAGLGPGPGTGTALPRPTRPLEGEGILSPLRVGEG